MSEASRKARIRSLVVFWSLAGGLIAVDQWSKNLAVERLSDGSTKALLGDWFGLHLVRNPGAAFSMGTSFTEVLAIISCIAALVVLWLSLRLRSAFWAVGFGFLFAGIVGNLIDRLTREPGVFQGHVIDFFRFPDFPVFNVADICINVAAGVIIVQTFRGIALDGTRHDDTPADDTPADDTPADDTPAKDSND